LLALAYVRSSIFKNPNPLVFAITLPSSAPSKVPAGVRNGKTFLEVGQYLHSLLIKEINHGIDPYLLQWKNKPSSLTKAYQAQFTAYAQCAYPFTIGMSLNQTPLEWWLAFEGTESAGILAVSFKLILFAFQSRLLISNIRPSQSSYIRPFLIPWQRKGQCLPLQCLIRLNETDRRSALSLLWLK
jgi:hypothetical protein